MKNTNMRRGFTMIELIFVIVIIGILAAVAIPKLAANRDDAEASTCIHEVGQLIQEMSASYTKLGNANYTASKIKEITNITTDDAGTKGITDAGTTVLASGAAGKITYECDDKAIVELTGTNAGSDFNLSVEVKIAAATTPASKTAAETIEKNIGADATSHKKIFTL